MKTIIYYIALISFFLTGQKLLAQDVFDKFQKQSNIETVVVNKKMFQMMANVKMDSNDKENQAYLALIRKLDLLTTYKTKNAGKATELKTAVVQYTGSKNMDQLMTVNEKGNNIVFYVNKAATRSNINELVMFTDGAGTSETVVLILTGNFSLDEISALTSKMNLPGGGAINKASK